jgi:hypothetical protein
MGLAEALPNKRPYLPQCMVLVSCLGFWHCLQSPPLSQSLPLSDVPTLPQLCACFFRPCFLREFWATKPNAMRKIGRVITTSVTSHSVEQLFSTLKQASQHETTGKRVNTKVATVAHYLHLKSMPTIKGEPDPEDSNFPIEPPPPPPWL